MLTVTDSTLVSSLHVPATTKVLRTTAFFGGYVIAFDGGTVSTDAPRPTSHEKSDSIHAAAIRDAAVNNPCFFEIVCFVFEKTIFVSWFCLLKTLPP